MVYFFNRILDGIKNKHVSRIVLGVAAVLTLLAIIAAVVGGILLVAWGIQHYPVSTTVLILSALVYVLGSVLDEVR